MSQEIIQKEDPVLRQIAKDVPVSEIASPEIQKIISRMRKALNSQKDGVAIAAPQIGVSLRIFIISGKVFDMQEKTYDENAKGSKNPDLVCINPVISKLSKDKKEVEEGCLSVRYLYGKYLDLPKQLFQLTMKMQKNSLVERLDFWHRPFSTKPTIWTEYYS